MRTSAAVEKLGLDSYLAKQLLKNGGGLSSLMSMIMEAGKMMVEHGIPDTDAKYKSMLAELVKIMVATPPPFDYFLKSFTNGQDPSKFAKRTYSGLSKRDEIAVLEHNNIVVVGTLAFASTKELLGTITPPNSFLEQLTVYERTNAGTVDIIH